MSKHTAGPWKFLEAFGRVETAEYIIAYIAGAVKAPHFNLEQQKANGTLIEAAPEMLEALEEAQKEFLGLAAYLETCDPDVIIDNVASIAAGLKRKKEIVEAAIRKAKGE